MSRSIFTSESVTCGHPDKVCDQIADRILDHILRQDPEAHVACEVTACTDQVHVFGEVTTDAEVDYENVARQVIAEIGYDPEADVLNPPKSATRSLERVSTRRAAASRLISTVSHRILPEASVGAARRKTG